MFAYLRRRLRYRLHCIIDTAGKSLHGWFDAPRDRVRENRLKAGLVAFTRSVALEEARNGITVNVVNPPIIDDKDLSLAEAERLTDARFPVGRPATARDVAEAVRFFASEEASFITGQVINVSGGWVV